MPLSINTNHAAVRASRNLAENNKLLTKSMQRLASGKRIIDTSDDAGGLAVAMKLNSSIEKLKGVSSNIKNAISFLDVQDGILQGAAGILERMSELKSLSQDVLKILLISIHTTQSLKTYRYNFTKCPRRNLTELVFLQPPPPQAEGLMPSSVLTIVPQITLSPFLPLKMEHRALRLVFIKPFYLVQLPLTRIEFL